MSSAGSSTGDARRGVGLATNRLEALVDGVFAVVMTLLVLDIKVPHPANPADLLQDLSKLRSTLLSYALSFVIAGIYWVGHHNQFAYIRRTNRPLLWINILFLMCVAFIPFSAALLAAYPGQRIAVIIYGANLIVVGLVLYLHWWYATTNHRLVDADLDPHVVRLATTRILMAPVIYVVAIGLSFVPSVGTALSISIYVLVPVLYILPGHIDRHLLGLHHHEPEASAPQDAGVTRDSESI
ncbi:MAG TPA: TMEM175 family protein [Chloroflexota bacterium]|jgi:uncharacterized membrane protein|nr:TMEM175 family protein [Chloroflexota bacterium]